MQYYFGVNCIAYLFMLQNIFSDVSHVKIEQELLIDEEITEVPAGWYM